MDPLKRIEEEEKELLKKIGAPTEEVEKDEETIVDSAKSDDDPSETTEATQEETQEEEQLATPSIVDELKKDLEQSESRLNGFRRAHETKINEFKGVIHNLNEQIVSLKDELGRIKSNSDIWDGVFTPEDSDMVGDEAIELVKRASEKAIDPIKRELEQLRQKSVRDNKAQLEEASKKEYSIFLAHLEKALPEYKSIDSDPGFITYLNNVDPVSGFIRKELFSRAEKSRDVGRVASFMLEYRDATQTKSKTKSEKMESKITPTGNQSAAVPKEDKDKTLSMNSIREYYRDYELGKFKGREEERLQIERKIDEAFASGKIRS